ncbi:1-deoxy-D-xylulose-5-phosphate synthase [Clostridia bacterium]|nr:1-deoxy-D-xylulose-5-phosphate synthase [Clostridia bacterium]
MSILETIDGPEQLRKLNITQLEQLAEEIRQEIIFSVSKTGGHLASSLGTVEITLAWHYVFSSPKDQVIWDVGHQSYAHKLITGRKDQFCTLRQLGGLSGFPKRCESEHDIFETGHSATSISAAMGIAEANRIKGIDQNVTAVIGDGALTGGMAFEAINHAGHKNTNFLVILNDNEMSIDNNVGALSNYLVRARTGSMYLSTKRGVASWIEKIPVIGKPVRHGIERLKDGLKYFFISGILFEELGFTYLGPIDGHDIRALIDHLERIKSLEGPVLLHVVTQKGRGYTPAVKNPEKFHGVGAFHIEDGKMEPKNRKTFTQSFSEQLLKQAEHNQEIVAITAAMAKGTGMSAFQKKYPERFFDTAIAEQHAVTFAAGLATAGLKPVVAIYATFMQRAVDQVIHDVCMQKLPVVFCVDRSGLVGQDGETHQGIMDFGIFKSVPNLEILMPCDEEDMELMMAEALNNGGPVMIRYPRDVVLPKISEHKIIEDEFTWIGKEGDILIVSASNSMMTCIKAKQELKNQGIEVALMGVRRAKPFPEIAFARILKNYKAILVVEENCRENGLGASILQIVNCVLPVQILALPDEFIEHGLTEDLRKKFGIDDANVVKTCRKMQKGLTM